MVPVSTHGLSIHFLFYELPILQEGRLANFAPHRHQFFDKNTTGRSLLDNTYP